MIQLLIEVPEDLGFRAVMEPKDVATWLRTVVVEGLLVPDDRAREVRVLGPSGSETRGSDPGQRWLRFPE